MPSELHGENEKKEIQTKTDEFDEFLDNSNDSQSMAAAIYQPQFFHQVRR